MNNYCAWVYVDRVTPLNNTTAHWKPFTTWIAAQLFMKVNGYKLLAKEKIIKNAS